MDLVFHSLHLQLGDITFSVSSGAHDHDLICKVQERVIPVLVLTQIKSSELWECPI